MLDDLDLVDRVSVVMVLSTAVGLAGLLRELDDDPLRAANVAGAIAGFLEVLHLADELRAPGRQAPSAASRSSTRNVTG
jgi:hypothetical protein